MDAMNGQAIVVAVVVAACAVYAAWTLAPRAARRAVASALLKRTWPAPVTRVLERHARADSGCGCDGCDGPEKRAPEPSDGTRPITFQRQPPR
jgi:hypothetical protein